jgi:hypothetical protein
LPTNWISQVKWENEIVIVNVTTEQVENGPEYNSSAAVNEVEEKKIYDYYGRRK